MYFSQKFSFSNWLTKLYLTISFLKIIPDYKIKPISAYRTQVELKTGLRGTAFLKVEDRDLSVAFNSGEVPVLATPRVVALIEEATLDAISGSLEKNKTTVGMRIRVDHLTPISLGVNITAHAILEQVDGRRLTFSATVETEKEKLLVANATITRVMVDTEEFLASVKP